MAPRGAGATAVSPAEIDRRADMSILVNADTKVICQGITGSFGAVHTKGCLHYGTKMVGGVTPGQGRDQDENGLPIFNTVQDAVTRPGRRDDDLRAPAVRGRRDPRGGRRGRPKVICCITEGVPVNDMIRVRGRLDEMNLAASGAFEARPAEAPHRARSARTARA
jgi:succinyl-CoA synthetase alpha subunit